MGTETYPKKGRSRQGFAGDHHKILSHGDSAPAPVSAPSSNDQPAHLKGKAWDLSRNKTSKAC